MEIKKQACVRRYTVDCRPDGEARNARYPFQLLRQHPPEAAVLEIIALSPPAVHNAAGAWAKRHGLRLRCCTVPRYRLKDPREHVVEVTLSRRPRRRREESRMAAAVPSE